MAAGVVLGYLKYVLGFDSLQFRRGMSQAERDLVAAQKRMAKQGQKIANIGKTLSGVVTLPLAAFGIASFKAAKDAEELNSAFNTTFGKMSGRMDKWAEATGNALGRSTREMKEAANTFGIFFNTAVPPAKAAQMSATFAKLAQDLGSFFNVDTKTAIEKLRAGLSGESEPLRAFGVFLNEAAVKAKALELGLGGVGRQLTEQEKIQARYALILQATAKAQGDVARTQDSTANQMRKAAAAWEELQIIVGTKLLPVLTPLIEKLASALDWFTRLPTPVQNTALAVAGITAVLGPLMVAFGPLLPLLLKLGPAFVALRVAMVAAAAASAPLAASLLPILGPLAAVAAAVGAVYLAWKNWDKIEPILKRLGAAVKAHLSGNLTRELDAIKAKVRTVGDEFRDLYDRVVGHSYIPDMVSGIAQSMSELQRVMVDPALSATEKVGHAFQSLGGLVGELFGSKAGSIVSSLGQLALALAPLFGGANPGVISEAGARPRARGGPVVPGRRYLVGERGPEYVSFGSRGYVHPNRGGGGARVIIAPSPLFEAVVQGQAAEVAAPMAGQAAIAGAAGGMAGIARQRSRTFP